MGLLFGILMSILSISLGNHIVEYKMYDFASLVLLGMVSVMALTMIYLFIYPVALDEPDSKADYAIDDFSLHKRYYVDLYDRDGVVVNTSTFSDIYAASEFYYTVAYSSAYTVAKNFKQLSMEEMYVLDSEPLYQDEE